MVNRRQFLQHSGAMFAQPAAGQASFRAGFSERDISPQVGMERPGNYFKFFHKSFHDPCKARAAVFDDGRNRVALVGVDALMAPRELVLRARKEIAAKCAIPAHAVLVGASHSHTSGPVGMVQPGQYDHASALVRRLANEESSCADGRYLTLVCDQIVSAVCDANARLAGARYSVGCGREDKVAFSRRFRMKNGRTYTYPGQGNPEVVDAAGPIDPQVGVVGAWDSNGRLGGCIVSYACHGTTNRPGISANWIYDLENTIRGVMGPQCIVVFLQGASGDVAHRDERNPNQYPAPADASRIVGGRVGAEAVKVLLSAHPGAMARADAQSTILKIKRRVPRPDRVRRCLEIVSGDRRKVDATEWIFAKETVLLDALLAKEPVAEVEIQAIQLGAVVFISNPAELFCQFGLDLKTRSPFPITCPVELANGSVGYVPTEEALSKSGGGYETRLTSYSNLEATAGRQMVAAGLALAGRMKPGDVPMPPKAAAFEKSSEWSYGDVPAELE